MIHMHVDLFSMTQGYNIKIYVTNVLLAGRKCHKFLPMLQTTPCFVPLILSMMEVLVANNIY